MKNISKISVMSVALLGLLLSMSTSVAQAKGRGAGRSNGGMRSGNANFKKSIQKASTQNQTKSFARAFEKKAPKQRIIKTVLKRQDFSKSKFAKKFPRGRHLRHSQNIGWWYDFWPVDSGSVDVGGDELTEDDTLIDEEDNIDFVSSGD